MKWLRQLFCSHLERKYITERVNGSMSRTTGGCVRCSKWIAPGHKRCGR